MNDNRVVVAMSGGIDSSVAAKLLINQGFEVIGVTFDMYNFDESTLYNANVCDALIIADKLGIKHFTVDIKEDFEQKVIKYFVNSYFSGITPNPCTLCNRIVKWKHLIDFADKIDAKYVATGHYAKIFENNGRYYISKGIDNLKDQSYFLWNLSQEQISRTLFPLSNLTKEQIKLVAAELGFTNVLHKRESFDVCFTRGMDYREFIKLYVQKMDLNQLEGDIITEDGTVVGKHNGFINYTIGQRKGLNVAMGVPYFVKKIDVENNRIVICSREDFNSYSLLMKDVNFQKYSHFEKDTDFLIKIRYRDVGHKAKFVNDLGNIKVEFFEPIFGIAAGQSAVVYDGDDIVAGGVIL